MLYEHSHTGFYVDMFSVTLGIYLILKLLSHVTYMFNILKNCQNVFWSGSGPFYNPTSQIWRFQFLHSLINITYCLCCYSHPSGKGGVSGDLVFYFLSNDINIFGISICISPLENLFKSFCHFSNFANYYILLVLYNYMLDIYF